MEEINKSLFSNTKYIDVPSYLTKAQLLEASKDCLSFEIIQTDRKKLDEVLKQRNTEGELNNVFTGVHSNEVYGYLRFNENREEIFFLREGGVQYLEVETSGSSGYVICINPLLITLELGQTWGFLMKDNVIDAVEVCSPEEDLYDWKAEEDWTGEPYIRKADDWTTIAFKFYKIYIKHPG